MPYTNAAEGSGGDLAHADLIEVVQEATTRNLRQQPFVKMMLKARGPNSSSVVYKT